MKIGEINPQFNPIESIVKPRETESTEGVKKSETSFSQMFGNAMKEVNDLQIDADRQIEGLVSGADNVSPHGAMIALEKADMAFQMMNAVRTKIIRAYEEVIRTQV